MRSIFLALCVLVSITLPAQKWQLYTSPKGAFSANFPAAPEVKEITRQTSEGFAVTGHIHMMFKEPVTAFVIYSEFEVGINIENDSIYLNTVAEEMLSKLTQNKLGTSKPAIRDIVFDGYPGKAFSIAIEDMVGELKIVLRSNRAYTVAGVFPKKQKADLDKFFTSFKFLPFQPTQFTQQKVGKDMKLDLPSKPVFDKESSEELGEGVEVYSTQDLNTGDSYSILITPYSKYTQYENDSTYLEERLGVFRSEVEAHNKERFLSIDGRLAKEIIVTSREHMSTRYLAFFRGNVGYLMLTTTHPSHIKNVTSEKIFNGVTFDGKPSGDLFSDKSSIVLKDLVSADTAIANPAKEAMSSVSFTEDHLDVIMGYIEKKYADDADLSNSRKELLLDALNSIKSEKSIAFIEKIFPTLNKNSIQEFSAIATVAAIKTRPALEARIRLITKHVPSEDIIYHPILGIYTVDSADQKYFYEKTNQLLKVKSYKLSMYYMMKQLMEQKRLTIQEIAPWHATINTDFDAEFNTFKKDSSFKSLDDFIIMMKHFETLDKKQIGVLKELSSCHDTYLGILASTTLLKHKQAVAAGVLTGFAKDHYNRITLYDDFENAGILQHYPKAYLNQDSLAVSQVYLYLQEEDFVPAKVAIAYQGLEDYHGKKMKFYVMRIYDADAEMWYRGTIGPFEPNKLATWGEMNFIDFQEDPKESYKQYLINAIAETEAVESED